MRLIDADGVKRILQRLLIPNDMGETTVEQAERWFLDIIDKAPTVEMNQWTAAKIMPPNDNPVLVWFEYFRYGNYNRLYRTFGISSTFNGRWCGFVNGESGWQDLKILAWMPLPKLPERVDED